MRVELEIALEQRGFVEMEVEIGVGVVELLGMHVVDLVLVVEQFQVPGVDGEILLSFDLISDLDSGPCS